MKTLGICRTAFYVSKMVMCAVLVVFSLSGRAQSSVMMEKETCAFLQSLPAGLQKTQADAVRRAINGDCTALISVRNSRNAKPESKSGVVTTDIGGRYRLYRPVGFDTIPLPVLIYLQGGGWCFGSINSCAHFCAERQLFFEKKRDFLFTETSFCCIINTDKTLPDPVQAEEC